MPVLPFLWLTLPFAFTHEGRFLLLDDLSFLFQKIIFNPSFIFHQLCQLREEQRRTARKIKYVRGKIGDGSMTMVTVQTPTGELQDIVEKAQIEQAIMQENAKKYKQSFHTPFLRPPLVTDFGFLGIGQNSEAVLNGKYKPPNNTSPFTNLYLEQLAYPNNKCTTCETMARIPVEEYRAYWKTAKEHTSSYPGAINFSSLKAGAHSHLISTLDCIMTRLPIMSGFSPSRWCKCIDVMIL
jgi:hypothetical protein